MIGKSGSNFFVAHYDWIAAAVAVVALVVGGIMFAGSLGTDADELSGQKLNEVKAMTPGGEKVQPADLTAFKLASTLAKNPMSIPEVADAAGSFLASEARIFCTNCQAVVLKDAKTCPSCNATLEAVKAEDKDADQDGMPNDWEKKYGLNPNDPADADLDKDGDGFTNLEEFEAKTDPTDRNDHSDYLDFVKVLLPLNETALPFVFTGTMKTPGGLKFKFKDPSRAKEYDRGIYSVLAGEEIGKSGFAPKELVTKSEERKMSGGMTKKIDVSEAIVVRKGDGKAVAMQLERKGVPVDVQAKLSYSRDGGKTFEVVAGSAIELSGTKYVVKSIKKTAKGAAVAIENPVNGKIRELSALEP